MRRRTVEVKKIVAANRRTRHESADVVVDLLTGQVLRDREGRTPRAATEEELRAARAWRPMQKRLQRSEAQK